MMRPILSLLLFVALLQVPVAAEGQRSSGDMFRPGDRMLDPADLGTSARVFMSTLEAIRDLGISAEPDSVLWDKAFKGLLRELNDPYAAVLTPDEVRAFQEESTGNYAGIGVQITELNEAVTITAVFRNTPADQEGLLVGDRIVEVNGEDAVGWTVGDASERIRGEPGTTVEVTIAREGISQPIPHRIERAQVHVPAVRARVLPGGTGYIALDRVARNSAAEVDSVLAEQSESTQGLILDLRRNPGGYLDESLTLADLFLDRGSVLVSTRSRAPGSDGELQEDFAYARRAARSPDKPLVILVDRYSASASEIIAGALQDYDRAVVIGERTFGKGSVQTVVPLPADYMIRLTSGEWYTPRGRSLNIPRDREGRAIGPDSVSRFTSEGGRTLWGGGGVYPHIAIAGDTLTTKERAFVGATVDAEIPLSQRIREAAFAAAQIVRGDDRAAAALPADADVPDSFPSDALDRFVDGLADDGLDFPIDDEIRSYLQWRLEVELYERLDLLDRSLAAQARRDPVLAKALDLLSQASSQRELLSLVPETERPVSPMVADTTGAPR